MIIASIVPRLGLVGRGQLFTYSPARLWAFYSIRAGEPINTTIP